MRAVISVSLPKEMVARLEEVVSTSGRAKSEVVKEALRRYLWEERFDTLRRGLARKARRRSLVTEEDVFRATRTCSSSRNMTASSSCRHGTSSCSFRADAPVRRTL